MHIKKIFYTVSTSVILIAVIVSIHTQFSPKNPASTPRPVLGAAESPLENEKIMSPYVLFDLVNQYRAQKNLEPLEEYQPLCEYAQKRSEEIKADWSHDQFYAQARGGDINDFCPECREAGENLAHFYFDEKTILDAWIASPTHKKNLEKKWDWACISIFENNYTALVFGKKR